MIRLRSLCVAIFLSCVCNFALAQDTLLYTPPYGFTVQTLPPSDLSFEDSGPVIAADDFQFDTPFVVRFLGWAGAYSFGDSKIPEEDDFTIEFFTESDGLPNENGPFASINVGSDVYRRDPPSNDPELYLYSASIPDITFQASTKYFVSIQANTSEPNSGDWFWWAAENSLSTAWHYDSGDTNPKWMQFKRDHFVLLFGEFLPIPEPTTATLLIVGIAAAATRRRR